MSVVTLLSGGLDSALIAVLLKEEGIKQYPLFIDYGQLAAKKEYESCLKLCKLYEIGNPYKVHFENFGKLYPCGLTSKNKRIYEDAFLPGRNMLFLLIAATYACRINCQSIAIGLLSEEFHFFPDQTKYFIKEMESIISQSHDMEINIMTPLIEFTKPEIIAMAKLKGINTTYSCHYGDSTPCNKCVSCKETEKQLIKGG